MQTTLDCKKKISTSPNRREIPLGLIRKAEWVSQKEKRDRDTGGKKQREREGGMVQCFTKKRRIKA